MAVAHILFALIQAVLRGAVSAIQAGLSLVLLCFVATAAIGGVLFFGISGLGTVGMMVRRKRHHKDTTK